MTKPKILFYDIETSLQPVAVFSLANNDWIDPSNILAERYVICASWRWEGESKIHTVSVLDDPKRYKRDPHDDLHVIKTLHAVLSEADVIVGHNADNFDKKYVDTRILFHGLEPLPPITSIDTYKVAKSKLLFNSAKLDYIGKFLNVGKKIKTSPGLWLRVLNGEAKAVREMVAYNKQDVVLLEKVFYKLRPYMSSHINRELFGGVGCPKCGSVKIHKDGFQRTKTQVYQRWQCSGCLSWFRTSKAEKGQKPIYRVL